MKRPKQQSQSLSFLNFFSRKPKSDPKIEKPTGTLNKDEVAITLTPNEHVEKVRWIYFLIPVKCKWLSIQCLPSPQINPSGCYRRLQWLMLPCRHVVMSIHLPPQPVFYLISFIPNVSILLLPRYRVLRSCHFLICLILHVHVIHLFPLRTRLIAKGAFVRRLIKMEVILERPTKPE